MLILLVLILVISTSSKATSGAALVALRAISSTVPAFMTSFSLFGEVTVVDLSSAAGKYTQSDLQT
jgi:hypothetical protein